MALKPTAPSTPRPWLLANHRFLAFLAFLLIIAGGLILSRHFLIKLDRVQSIQAVFLSNGQVYFGHLKYLDRQWAELTHIYYLQVNQPLQQGQQPEDQPAQPQLTLIKLGEELHGPEDQMTINRDHILFVENLKENGRVVQTIRQSAGPQ